MRKILSLILVLVMISSTCFRPYNAEAAPTTNANQNSGETNDNGINILAGGDDPNRTSMGAFSSTLSFESFNDDDGFTKETGEEGGFRLSNNNGDHAVTSTEHFAKALSFKAQAMREEGKDIGIIIAKSDTTGAWPGIGAMIDGDDNAKLFWNPDERHMAKKPLTDEQKQADHIFNFELTADASGHVVFKLDDVVIHEFTDSTYEGGWVGLITHRAEALFNNIEFQNLDADTGETISDIPLNSFTGGGLADMGNGFVMSRGNGDHFVVSDESAKALSYEADVTLVNNGSAALVIGMNELNTGWPGIAANIDKNDAVNKVAKLFKEQGNQYPELQPYNMTNEQKASNTYHIKITADENGLITYYLDDVEIHKRTDTNYQGGYVGLLTYNSAAVFNNIKFENLDAGTKSDLPFDGFNEDAGFTDTGEGFKLSKAGGDHFITSDVSAKVLDYSADITIADGDRSAALVIGRNTDTGWPGIGANIDLGDGGGVAKLFKNPNDVFSFTHTLTTEQKADMNFNIRLTANEEGLITYYLDGEKILETTDATYQGGRVGLLTFDSEATFNNIKFESGDPTGDFRTNLVNIQGFTGLWEERAAGLFSNGNGDNFALSESTADDFTYEATISTLNSTGAGSLAFRASGTANNNFTGYVANVDSRQRNTRIFKFYNGGYMGDIVTGSVPATKDSYKVRVEAIGENLKLYVDDVLIGERKDPHTPALTDGKLGFLTFNDSIVYQDVFYHDVDPNNLPRLTGLTASEGELLFAEGKTTYNLLVENNVTSITVTPVTADGNTMAINAVEADSTVSLEEEPIVSGVASPEIPLAVGGNTINIKVTDSNGVSIITSINVERKIDRAAAYKETYRPQLHFTTLKNFINDPNGLVFDPSNNTWHMFYQYNPYGMDIGNQTWGHAQSDDLINWEELPIAIPQGDGLGAIFSGSAVVDEENTSGFFTDNVNGESKLVAMFTHDRPGDTTYGVEKQSIAYSKDHGLTWVLYPGNPVIPNTGEPYGRDFRDPKVFKILGEDDRWFMVIAGGRARLFSSENLINWTLESEFENFDGSPMNSECPDLYPLVTPDGETKWVYTASGVWYSIGDLEKNGEGKYEFFPDQENERIKYNSDMGYATQSFYNDGSGQGRRLAVHWLQDHTSHTAVENQYGVTDKVWNGTQTIAQEVTLIESEGGLRLNSYPAEEINEQRSSAPVLSVSDMAVSEDSENILANFAGKKYDLEARINMGDAEEVGFRMFTGAGNPAVLSYNDSSKLMTLDTTGMSYQKPGISTTFMEKDENGDITFRIIMDVSVIEAFGNGGAAAVNKTFFADPNSVGLEFYANGGTAQVESIDIYDMKSIYRDDLTGGTVPTQLFLSGDTRVYVGDEVTINAAILPMTAANRNVTWEFTGNASFEEVSRDEKSITLKALAPGTADVTADSAEGGLQETITVEAIEVNFNTNLSGWDGVVGTWELGPNGYSSRNGGMGDAFAIAMADSGVNFTYEAEISEINGEDQGAAVGLVFGVQNPANPPSQPWYCMNFNTENRNFKIFYNRGNSEVWNESGQLTQAQFEADTKTIRVVLENGVMKYFMDIDDGSGFQQLAVHDGVDEFTPGAFGMITFHADATFDDVMLSYNVVLGVNKDDAVWTDSGKAFTLRQNGDIMYSGSSETGTVTFPSVLDGTYNIYEGETNTGIEVVADGGGETAEINYYTVDFDVADAEEASGSTISANYGGSAVTPGTVVMGGKTLVITAAGAGAEGYGYLWSGTGTNGETAPVLTVTALEGKIDATCTVTGRNNLPPIDGTLDGLALDTATGELTATVSGGSGTYSYVWTVDGQPGMGDADGNTYIPDTAELGKIVTCTVTKTFTTGSLSKSETVYMVVTSLYGNVSGDTAVIAAPYGKAGDTVSITYTVEPAGDLANSVAFSGGNVTGSDSPRSYVISADDAENGVITITAEFTHTDSQQNADTAAPTVKSVTPSGTGQALNGSVIITFNEAMDTSAVNSVMLNNTVLPQAQGTWSNNGTVYVLPYTGLAYSTEYTVNITGFKDAAGNAMADDSSRKFTTLAQPLPNTYTVKFNTNDGSTVGDMEGITSGSLIKVPANPVKAGFTFGGWFRDVELKTKWNFTSDKVTANITLYAKWAAIQQGALQGTVKIGSVGVENVTVTVKTGGTNGTEIARTVTDAEGSFSFGTLPYGVYSLVAEDANGVVVTKHITVNSGNVPAVNITIPNGKLNTVVEVKEETPSVAVENLEELITSVEEDEALTGAVEIKLLVDKKEGTEIAASDSAAIDAKVGAGKAVAVYLDVTLLKTVTAQGQPSDETEINEANKPLNILIELPAELWDKAPYQVIRLHGSVAETLPAAYDATLHTLTFTTDRFSTYAIVVTESTDDGGNEGGNGGNTGGGSSGGSSVGGGSGGGTSSAYFRVKESDYDAEDGGDLTITLTRNGNTLRSIKNGSYTLKEGTDYTENGSTIEIKESYLETLEDGEYEFVFDMSLGSSPVFTVTVTGAEAEEDTTEEDTEEEETAEPETETTPAPYVNPFVDVDPQEWYGRAVEFVYTNGIMNGTDTEPMTFSPQTVLTRGMIVTMLWNMEGKPSSAAARFTDVRAEDYYYQAANWAAESGIVAGMGDGSYYAPAVALSRQDLVAILARYTDFAELSLTETKEYSAFADEANIAAYAKEAVERLYKAGVFVGKDGNNFDPQGQATRAEVAQMLMQLVENAE